MYDDTPSSLRGLLWGQTFPINPEFMVLDIKSFLQPVLNFKHQQNLYIYVSFQFDWIGLQSERLKSPSTDADEAR